MDMKAMLAKAHDFGHWNSERQKERIVVFHTGEENTPIMLEETRELMELTRKSNLWQEMLLGLKRQHAYVNSDQLFVEPLQPIMMADGTQITGTTEASLWPIQFTTFAANSNYIHKAAQHLEFISFGVATTPASAATTATVTPRWGTTTSGTSLGPSAASATVTASKTNVPYYLTGNLQVRSVLAGANSVMVGGGDFVCDQIAIPGICFGGTVISSVDTTASGGIWIGMTLGGSASFTMTARALLVKNVS